jgi:probable cell surface glycoprotein
MTKIIKSIISRLGILMAILVLSMPLSANAQINIRDGAADSDLVSLMEMYEYSGDSSILDLIWELADAGGFSEEKEQQARAYVQDKRNPVQPEESTPAPEEMPTQAPEESTEEPTAISTTEPVESPTPEKTPDPTTEPTETVIPTEEPTIKPTIAPTPKVTATPIPTPTTKPIASPVSVIDQTNTSTHSGWYLAVIIIVSVVLMIVIVITIHKFRKKR